MEKHGGDVWEGRPEDWLDFSASLRPEGPPDWVTRTLGDSLRLARYYPDPRMREAARGLAAYLGVPEECVLPTAGGVAALDLALSLSGGRVLLRPPAFGEYEARARARGRRIANGRETAGPGDTLVLCNPDNPTGRALSREAVLALHEELGERGAELLADEAFCFCCPEVSVARCIRPGLTVAGSLTKALGIPGIRLGYLVSEARAIDRLRETALPWQLSAPASAVAAALPGHMRELAEDAARNAERRGALRRGLTALGARVPESRANFLLADFGRDMRGAVRRLRAEHILVRACGSFGLGDGVLRIAVRTEAENERLLARLRAALEEEACGERA